MGLKNQETYAPTARELESAIQHTAVAERTEQNSDIFTTEHGKSNEAVNLAVHFPSSVGSEPPRQRLLAEVSDLQPCVPPAAFANFC